MAQYIYETHMHTVEGSACGKTPGKEYIRKYQDAGYSGIIITDHFYRGNCRIDRSLPWREFIHQFCLGFEHAWNEGQKVGFPVFFGWEENFHGDEYLIYGLDKAWLLEHPDMPTWDHRRQYEEVHRGGGCVVQAHPFRARDYNHAIYLPHALVDAVEGVNAANEMRWNSLALRYAKVLGIPATAGSDNHDAQQMRSDHLAGVVFDHPLRDIHDYVHAIVSHEPFVLHLPQAVPAWDETMEPDLPVHLFDQEDHEECADIMALLRGDLPR